jgi:hypothetical protein
MVVNANGLTVEQIQKKLKELDKLSIKIHYKVRLKCPVCKKFTGRTGKISLHSPEKAIYRVDYPCKCGHNDHKLFPGVVALTDPKDLEMLFCDYPEPKVKVKKPKGKHSKGLFDHLLKAKKR